MKVLDFIQSLIVPSYMGKRKNMNIFVSFLILLLCAFVMSLPISSKISNQRYETFDALNFDILRYVDDSKLVQYPFTEEENNTYNMITFEEFKALDVYISLTGMENTDGVECGKEYVLKSFKPVLDEDGTIKDYKIYYVHIVFDFEEEAKYDITENFDKLKKDEDGTFAHFLLVFYNKTFTYRSSYEIDKNLSPSKINYYKKITISLSKLNNMEELSNTLIDMQVPLYQYNYRLRTLLFVAAFPMAIAMLFALIFKSGSQLKGMKQFINIASVSSITLTLCAFSFSWVNNVFCNIIIQWYSVFFAVYYYIVIILINRKPRVE